MWYKSFKWKKNPFFTKFDAKVVGLEEEKKNLLDYISSGNISFLTGESGIGKTSLLMWIERNLRKHTVVYVDAEGVGEFFDLSEYLKQHRKLWRDFFSKYPKNIVVLLDEAQASEEDLKKALKLHWDRDYVKSIIVSQIDPLNNFSKGFKNRIGNRIIKLEGMSKDDALKMIELRTKGKNPFTKSTIDLITELSDHNPRKILENTERICVAMAKRGMKKINIDVNDVKSFFNIEEVVEDLPKVEIVDLEEELKTKKEVKKVELSPMQSEIVNLLKESNKTTQQIANMLNTSEGSVGKQLSKLSKTRYVRIVSDKRPKLYGLT